MDLKIKDVAELLSISEVTVRRWLAKGKIPAYRLNRQYRFNRAEIEDWVMRQKLNASDETLSSGNMQFSLYRSLCKGETFTIHEKKTKEELIAFAMKYMEKQYELDSEVLTDLFLDRERLMSTSLSQGIAVPHTRDFLINTHFDVILVVYPEKPIEYGALDGEPVHTLFFLFASEDRNHLNLLSKIAHFVSHEKNRTFLTSKPSKEKLLDCIKIWESTLNG